MGRLAAAVRECGGAEWYEPALEVLTRRAARAVGVEWTASGGAGEAERRIEEIAGRLDEETAGGFSEALAEPHALGWFHQHFGAPERAASHRAHHRDEAKHASQAATTQLYTPRWIADLVACEALEVVDVGGGRPTVLDPAVGGGQFLLAAYDELAARAPRASAAEIVGSLRGVDIDARAVEVAQRCLKLHVARRIGERRRELEEAIEERIGVADGLFDDLCSADVVLTNPPYMGSRSMPTELKARVRERYEPFHGDLYAAFIRRCHELAEGAVGVLAQQTIWYLKRFERARRELLERSSLEWFAHLGPHAFRTLSGEKANVVAFVQRSGADPGGQTRFVDLRDLSEPASMREAAVEAGGREGERLRRLEVDELAVIPGRPISYWLPPALRRHFDGTRRLGDFAEVPGSQHKTGANRTYVRRFDEVASDEIEWCPMRWAPGEAPARIEPRGRRWYFYSKGGRYAPWWGNWENVLDWSEEARNFYDDNGTSNLLAEAYRYREGICYTDFGGRRFNARWMPAGCLFDMAGPAIFPSEEGGARRRRLFALLAVLNTSPVRMLLNALNPSIHYQVTDLRRLPVPEWSRATGRRLADLAVAQIEDLRRLARGVEASPLGVAPGSAGGEAGELEGEAIAEVAARLGERERTVDEIAWSLYGATPAAKHSERARHHYLDKLQV